MYRRAGTAQNDSAGAAGVHLLPPVCQEQGIAATLVCF